MRSKQKVLIYLFLFSSLLGCINSQKNNNIALHNDNHCKEESSIFSIELKSVIKNYSTEYPLKQINDTAYYTMGSYNVTFLESGKDTILAIARQPFVFEVFSSSIFDMPDVDSIKISGMAFIEGKPIVVFDVVELVGSGHYKDRELEKNIPRQYYINDEKSYEPIIPPIWKYRVHGNELAFISKTDSTVLK